jgi:hypothetical protein
MVATGAYPRSGSGGRSWTLVALVNTTLAGAIIALLLHVLFDLDRDDVAHIAVPMAILNRVLNFVMMLALVTFVQALLAVARPTPPPAPAAPAAPPASAAAAAPAPQPADPQVAAADQQIATRIRRNPLVQEAREYYEQTLQKRTHRDLVQSLYAVGARKVYFVIGQTKRGLNPIEMIVELPDTADQRAAVLQTVRGFVQTSGTGADPASIVDQGNRYVSLPLPQ